jgi:GNAT superfamily N-acetyltransferase
LADRRADPSAALEIVRVAYGHPHAMQLIADVQAEYVARYGSPDNTPLDPLMFEPPLGSFYVGYVEVGAGPRPVASGAWRAHEDVEVFGTRRTAEVKRMYVALEVRARGHARAMLAHLERTAAEAGAEAMILETGTAQPEAMALYESSGYTPIPSFGFYKDEPLNRCYAKLMRGTTVSA